MDYFVIGEDKSLAPAYTKEETDQQSGSALPLAGGNMTGNIGYDSGVRVGDIIKFLAGDAAGNGIAIGEGGCVVLGSGESAAKVTPANASSEETIIASDTVIKFYVNVQNGIDSAVLVTMSKAGLLSGHQKAITSGTAAPSGGSNGDIYIQY